MSVRGRGERGPGELHRVVFGVLHRGVNCLSWLGCYGSRILLQRCWLWGGIPEAGCGKGFAGLLQSAEPGVQGREVSSRMEESWFWFAQLRFQVKYNGDFLSGLCKFF